MVRRKFLKAKAVTLAVLMALQSFGLPVHAQIQTGLNEEETATVLDLTESALVSENTTDGGDAAALEAGQPVENVTAAEYASSGRSSVAKLSMKELADLYEEIGSYSTLYKTAPVISGSGYKPAVLSDDAYNYVKKEINYYRTVAGLKKIGFTDELNLSASWGALADAMNNEITHDPAQPDEMSDEDYEKATHATSHSNLSYCRGCLQSQVLENAISGQIEDRSVISSLGHRRWLLRPDVTIMGVGSANNDNSYYTAVRVFGDEIDTETEEANDYDFIAWPASGNNLSDTFANSTPWSVTLNPSNYSTPDRSAVTVKLESVKNKTTWTFDSGTPTAVSDTSDYFNVNLIGYGRVDNCIIFRPAYKDLSAFSGDYIVSISGIKDRSGNATTLTYKVTFDTYENASQGGSPSISLNETEKTLYVGETLPLTVTIDPPEAGEGKTVVWSSSNKNVATVNAGTGLATEVTAVGKGEATITAAVGNSKVSCKVTVVNPVAGVTFDSQTATIHVGQTVDLAYTFTPVDAVAKNIDLKNGNDTAVSAVLDSERGYVQAKGLAVGTSVLTLNADGYSAQCTVTAKDTITLKFQDGTDKEQLVKAIVGAKLSALADIHPERDGYTFAGWYTSPDGKGNKVTANTILTNQFVLYAYWKVNGAADESLTAKLIPGQDLTFTGQALKPIVEVYAGDRLLQEKRDYTISYKNNKNAYTYDGDDKDFDTAKAPAIIITGKGIYSEKVPLYFTIQPRNINDPGVEVQEQWLKYNGKVQQKAPVVTYNKKKLSGKDVLCLPIDASIVLNPEGAYKAPADYEMQLLGQGNFTGERDVILHIYDPKDLINLAKVTVPKVADKTYTGGEIELSEEELSKITMKVNGEVKRLYKDAEYTIEYKNNISVGTATAIISPINGVSYGSKKITFKITGVPIKTAVVTGIENKIYSGSAQVQEDLEVKISGSDGKVKKLTEGTDYKAVYAKNVSVGTATLTIQGKGLYTGNIKTTFKILPYDLSLAYGGAESSSDAGNVEFIIADKSIGSVRDWKSGDSAPVVNVPYLKGGSMPTVQIMLDGKPLTEGTDYTVKYSNNKAVTTETIIADSKKMPTLTIKGKGGYKGTVAKTFTIEPKSIQDVVIYAPAKAASTKAGACLSKPVLLDDDGKALKEGTDYVIKGYTATYADSTTEELDKKSFVDQVGTVITVTVEGKGAYAGADSGNPGSGAGASSDADQTTTDYEITAKALTGVKVSAITKPYTGSAVELTEADFQNADGSSKVTAKDGKEVKSLVYGKDFEIIEGTYVSNVKIGTASVKIRGLGEYGGVATVKFKIGKKPLLGLIWGIFN